MFKKALFLLTSSMFLAACASTSNNADISNPERMDVQETLQTPANDNDNVPMPVEPVPQKVADSVVQVDKVTMRLIRMGEYALSERRLLTPEDDNANMYFQIALGRDPGNYDAILGISTIVDTYLDWAVLAAERGEYRKANEYLDNARFVNRDDPSISVVATRVENIKRLAQASPKQPVTSQEAVPEASEDVFILPQNLFELSEEEILEKIQPIIDRITETQRAVDINWPNDKEGRLIYQILNSRTPEFRVRAMIYHRARYTVELTN